ncbi:MAG: AraC family transcriptional regulator [Eubacteriales bacterium]|nr:AraC family transcriptional regulator [Eubacteriales bacterium]
MIPAYENRAAVLDAYEHTHLTFPAHLHGELELFLVLRGCMDVTCGGETRRMTAGELAVIAPNIIHAYTSPPDRTDGHFLLVICPWALLGAQGGVFSRLTPRTPFVPPENVHPHIRFAMEELVKARQASDAVHAALIQLILAHALPHLQMEKAGGIPADMLTRALVGVSAHLEEPLTLGGLADELGISPSALSRLFSRRLGIGFCDYLGRLRVQRAQGLLRGTVWSMSAIAAACGFETPRSFDRTFRRHAGLSPRQYRQAARQADKESSR